MLEKLGRIRLLYIVLGVLLLVGLLPLAFAGFVLSGGHGWKTFTKQDITEGREYFEYLTREVSAAMAKGRTLDQMRKEITLSKYKDWANYDLLRLWNVEAAYYNLKIYK